MGKEKNPGPEEAEGALHPEDMVPQESEQSTPKGGSTEEVAREALAGLWGRGNDRKRRLQEAGHDPNEVQAEVNRLLNL